MTYTLYYPDAIIPKKTKTKPKDYYSDPDNFYSDAAKEMAEEIEKDMRLPRIVRQAKPTKGYAYKLYEAQEGKCFYCDKPLRTSGSLDHFIPKSKGGSNAWYNMVMTHHQCNTAKGNRMPTEEEITRFNQLKAKL